ncbi:MAG: tetratricopeptide repeat protein, partial [Nitrospinaceae bacterium]
LKERVTEMARELVGDKLIDVSVSIRYLRTEVQGGGPRNIKLPGFNHYIRPGKDKKANIVSAHTRLRQVLVMVSDTLQSEPEALEQEIRLMGKLDTSKGDLVKVIKVSPGGKSGNGEMEGKRNGSGGKKKKSLLSRLKKEEENEQRGLAMAQGALIEAQSTTYLIKARAAFFKGDLDRALDQILQSISQNPNNPQAYAMLGSLYYAVDWKSMALKYWEKSLTLDPNNREIEELVLQVKQNPAQ